MTIRSINLETVPLATAKKMLSAVEGAPVSSLERYETQLRRWVIDEENPVAIGTSSADLRFETASDWHSFVGALDFHATKENVVGVWAEFFALVTTNVVMIAPADYN